MPATTCRMCSGSSSPGAAAGWRKWRRPPRFTYGFKKASILAALINALFLLVAIGAIGAEAVRRLFHPSPTHGGTVIIVAASGSS